MMGSKRIVGAVGIATGLCSFSCMTTYLQQPGVASHSVVAGAYSGPVGEMVAVNPGVIEYLLARPETNLSLYYEVALAHASEEGDILTRAAYQDARNDLEIVKSWPTDAPASAPEHERMAWGVAKSLAPHVTRSMVENGYGMINWGKKVTEDKTALRMIGNMVLITAYKDRNLLCLYRSSATEMTKMWPVSYKVADLASAWEPQQPLDMAAVEAKITKDAEPDQACIDAL